MTKTKVIEVKSGDPNDVDSKQLSRLKGFADAQGKSPVFAVRREQVENLSPELNSLLQRLGIAVEPYDL